MSTFDPARDLVIPDWPAPENVVAATTTRQGGVSTGSYASLNLADHVGDDAETVEQNRHIVFDALGVPQPVWLSQVHGCDVADASSAVHHQQADAMATDRHNTVCSVLTADCLPLLFCNRDGSRVAAAHAGWRGLAGGVIEATLDQMKQPAEEMLVWLGPAIGPDSFEVGQDVYDAFVNLDSNCATAFKQTDETHYLADIYQLAKIRLNKRGVSAVYGGGFCTMTDAENFYSFRRDKNTGRMASMIWLKEKG